VKIKDEFMNDDGSTGKPIIRGTTDGYALNNTVTLTNQSFGTPLKKKVTFDAESSEHDNFK